MNTIQQLEDLKEWSQDSTRYERRLNFRGGQLVQPGPGRQGYGGKGSGGHPGNIGDALPKKIKNFLIEAFDDVEFDWSKGRYGVSQKTNKALHTQIARVANDKIANPKFIYTPTGTDLSKFTYKKGWGTAEQLLEKSRLKGINAKEGRAASIFADNFNIKSKPNPYHGGSYIYDLTVLDDSKKVEKIIKKQVAQGVATKPSTDKYLSQDIRLAKKREKEIKRGKAVDKYSVSSIETELKGTRKVHLSHMDDIYSQFTTGQTLGYAPHKINREFLESYDNKFKQLYKKRARLLKEKPKDLIKQLEQINKTGARLAGETGGYKSFKFVDPYTLKPYQFGVDAAKTIDPLGILEGKPIKEIKNLSPEDRYFFEKNRKAVFASQKKVKQTKNFNELYTSGSEGRKTLKAITSLTGINDYLMANGMDPICVTKSPKKCGMDLIKSEGGTEKYRNALQERVAKATGDERWFKAYNNPKMASVKNFFKGAGKKLWKFGKAGVLGELYYIPFGTAYETGRGRNLLEALDNSIGLGGHFGMEEKNLMKYADKAGYSDEDKKFFKQFSQLEKNDNWKLLWQMAAAGDKWVVDKLGGYDKWWNVDTIKDLAAGKIKDLETESEDIIDSLYTGLGDEGVAGKWEEREHLKDVQTIDWINKEKEKEANVLINRDIMKKFKERAESEGKDPIWPLTPPAEKRWLVGENLVDAFTQDDWAKKIWSGEQKLKTEEAGPLWSTITSPIGSALAAGDKRIDEERRRKILEEAEREDLLYKEYMHPLYGPSFSMPQAAEQGRYGMSAGGGIAGIRRPWAIPPESGPMPQGGGLSSQFNRVKKLTE